MIKLWPIGLSHRVIFMPGIFMLPPKQVQGFSKAWHRGIVKHGAPCGQDWDIMLLFLFLSRPNSRPETDNQEWDHHGVIVVVEVIGHRQPNR